VQGVWFRAHTKSKAEELGITGWVRNLPNGNVEAIFSGNEHDINTMVQWCHQGPSLSSVESVKIKKLSHIENFESFRIRY
jgi:acylphosphatase